MIVRERGARKRTRPQRSKLMPSGVTGALLMASRNKHKISYARQYLVVRKRIDRDGRSRTREFILEITRRRKSISRNGEAKIRPSPIER